MVVGEVESESVLNVRVCIDHTEFCPSTITEMFPLDERNDCQVGVPASHFPLCVLGYKY